MELKPGTEAMKLKIRERKEAQRKKLKRLVKKQSKKKAGVSSI